VRPKALQRFAAGRANLGHPWWPFSFRAPKKLQNVMAVTEILPCSGTKHKGQNTDQVSREMAMEKKLMFVAFGYLLMLAALDASIAAMVVSG